MTGKVLNLDYIVSKDELGCQIANFWMTWNSLRQQWMADTVELRQYLFATDTRQTTNSQTPWKNSTTIPKLCQTRDNLFANYMASLFPKRKWMEWVADTKEANSKDKRDAIISYMSWVVDQDRFKQEISKLVLDYIDYGNAFATVEWIDERQTVSQPPVKVGYVGPSVRRISPLDIVFNPTAASFTDAPKIVRSLISIGEVKKILDSQSTDEDREFYEDLYKYLIEVRATVRNNPGADIMGKDTAFQVDGFTSFRSYLESDYCEILTFYGDIFSWQDKTLLPNHKIMVVDRHRVVSKKPNPSYFGYAPIFHCGWRTRQDNLWAMGPLNNLVGLQYRIDHVENLKADAFDLITFPVLKIKGYVETFEWKPGARIYLGEDGEVEMVAPPFQILQANIEIQNYMSLIEEMAGAPKEAMGFRSPGEKTAYEVQRLENASSRIFLAKIIQFEEFEERLLNANLELGRRNMGGVQEISIFDNEFQMQVFTTLTPNDITGAGRIKPVAARHFAEKAEMVQNLTNFYASGVGQDPAILQHMSSIQLARAVEDLLGLQDWGIVQPYIRIAEATDAERLTQKAHEQLMMEAQTPTGLTPDDHSASVAPVPDVPPMMPQQ